MEANDDLAGVFDVDPVRFLDRPGRLERCLQVMAKLDPVHGESSFALNRWEDLTGEACPADLANLMRAFASTRSVNTALYSQGRPLVVGVLGFGNLLEVPYGQDPEGYEMVWEGCFARGLTVDPGGSPLLRDLVRNRVEIGGDPFYFYELATGRLYPGSCSCLAAMTYACALREAQQKLSDEVYVAAVKRVLPHLAGNREPAETLFELLEDIDPELTHEDPWEAEAERAAFRLTDTPGEALTTREWLTVAVRMLQQRYARGASDPVEQEALVLLRELARAAAPPPSIQTGASDALYAGLHACVLEPGGLADWAEGARQHRSLLVRDGAEVLADGSHEVLLAIKDLVEQARACAAQPDRRVERCAMHPLEASLFYRHGRW